MPPASSTTFITLLADRRRRRADVVVPRRDARPCRRGRSASWSAARAAIAIAVSVGFFSGPVVKQLLSHDDDVAARRAPGSTRRARRTAGRRASAPSRRSGPMNRGAARGTGPGPSASSPALGEDLAQALGGPPRCWRPRRRRSAARSRGRTTGVVGVVRRSVTPTSRRRHHRAEHLHAERRGAAAVVRAQPLAPCVASPIVSDVAISGALVAWVAAGDVHRVGQRAQRPVGLAVHHSRGWSWR